MTEFSVPTNLPDWIQDHVRRYLETNGEDGHMWEPPIGGPAVPTLLLVTKGRRSGKASTLPLIYGEFDGQYVIVASKGGAPDDPAWYLNLQAEPAVRVQVGADRFSARARTAEGDERATLFARMTEVFPSYAEYAQRTEREIPVVVLEREG